MSFVNFSSKEIHLKILYFGPGLGGKTTNLQYIYYSQQPDLDLNLLKKENERTLFFDFLPVQGDSFGGFNVKIHLYTIPGQLINEEIRELILQGLDGIVFVVDSQRKRLKDNEESLQDLQKIMTEENLKIPMIIQLNKRDLKDIYPTSKLKKLLHCEQYLSQEAIASKGEGVFETLSSLIQEIRKEMRIHL